MKQQILTITENAKLNDSVCKMTLKGENLQMSAGQFVNVAVEGFTLRRPISVCDVTQNTLTLVYKIVGEGTRAMAAMGVGQKLDILTHLGVGFCIDNVKKPVLIGGGIGSAPLYYLAKEFNKKGIKPTIILGFRSKNEVFFEDEFASLGNLIIATDDGSSGELGNAVSVFKQKNIAFDRYFACGPMVMLKNLAEFSTNGQVSLEARMGCGFGACMGCSIKTTEGFKRVCHEGAVFNADTVIFE